MLGFLHRHERNEGLNGGLYHEHELDLDPSTVIEIRKQIEDENICVRRSLCRKSRRNVLALSQEFWLSL